MALDERDDQLTVARQGLTEAPTKQMNRVTTKTEHPYRYREQGPKERSKSKKRKKGSKRGSRRGDADANTGPSCKVKTRYRVAKSRWWVLGCASAALLPLVAGTWRSTTSPREPSFPRLHLPAREDIEWQALKRLLVRSATPKMHLPPEGFLAYSPHLVRAQCAA